MAARMSYRAISRARVLEVMLVYRRGFVAPLASHRATTPMRMYTAVRIISNAVMLVVSFARGQDAGCGMAETGRASMARSTARAAVTLGTSFTSMERRPFTSRSSEVRRWAV